MQRLIIKTKVKNGSMVVATKSGNNFGDQIISLSWENETSIIEEKKWTNQEGDWENFNNKSMKEKAKRYWPHLF